MRPGRPTERTGGPRPAGAVDVVVIGAGHAGLAASHFLNRRGIDHVVLERGEIANTWRTERWDSLRLLTPNWQSRLPGFAYEGEDPDGFMTMPEVVDFIDRYAAHCGAPVITHSPVESVEAAGAGYRVVTPRGTWRCRAVVLATGAFNRPVVPAVAERLPANIGQLTPHGYRNAQQLAPGGVLVVGASATGLQLAHEIRRAGHEVTLAVGEHVRMPRSYRGQDIQHWLHVTGILDEGLDDVDDAERARNLPSPQLLGAASPRILDLNALTARGVRLVGRLVGVNGGKAQFSGGLRNVCALADLKMERLLRRIDEWIGEAAPGPFAALHGAPEDYGATVVPEHPDLVLDLAQREIRTVIWATGFRPDYSWLHVDALDRKGRLRHHGGVVDAPGLYALGLPMLRRRKSSFIHGIEDDARDVTAHLAVFLRAGARAPAPAAGRRAA